MYGMFLTSSIVQIDELWVNTYTTESYAANTITTRYIKKKAMHDTHINNLGRNFPPLSIIR